MASTIVTDEFDEFRAFIEGAEFKVALEMERAEIARATIAPVLTSVRANIDVLRATMAAKMDYLLEKSSLEDFTNVALAREIFKLRYSKPYISGDDDHEWKQMIDRSEAYFSYSNDWLNKEVMLWMVRTPYSGSLNEEKLKNTAVMAAKLFNAGVEMDEGYYLVLWGSHAETSVNIKREGDKWGAFDSETGSSYLLHSFDSLTELIRHYHENPVKSRYSDDDNMDGHYC